MKMKMIDTNSQLGRDMLSEMAVLMAQPTHAMLADGERRKRHTMS